MRTTKRRKNKMKNRTIKGGENTKLHLIVQKSDINGDLIYKTIFERPAFLSILDYMNTQRRFVDEGLSWLRLEEVPKKDLMGNTIKNDNPIVYEDTIKYGYSRGPNKF
jgi:hypothetical protein